MLSLQYKGMVAHYQLAFDTGIYWAEWVDEQGCLHLWQADSLPALRQLMVERVEVFLLEEALVF